MSNTPSKAEIEALVKRHGATSYRNRADTQHPAYGFTEDGLNGLIDEVLAKWGSPQPVVREPLTDEQIQDLLLCGNPTDEEMRLIRIGWDAANDIKGGQHGTE